MILLRKSILNVKSNSFPNVNNCAPTSSDNHMAINVTKSKLMLVSSKHNHSQLYSKHSNIPFHDSCIEVVSCEKLLDVYINSTLSWVEHINNLIKRCNKYLYLVSHIKCYLSVPSRKPFYNAYIMPHFDYCCVIWGHCSAHLEDKLTKFPKRAARLILDRDFSTHLHSYSLN